MFAGLLTTQAAGSPHSDPFWVLRRYPTEYPPFRNAAARTRVSPIFAPSLRVLTIIGAGQSNITNAESDVYTVQQPAQVLNLDIFSGGLFQAECPLLGCSAGIPSTNVVGTGGNWMARLGDYMISVGVCDRVVLVPIGVGSVSVQNWIPGKFGTPQDVGHRIGVAARRLAFMGLTADAVLWMQGESDHGNTQVGYTDNLGDVIDGFRDVDIDAPFFVAQCTRAAGVNFAPVRAAQAAIVNHGAGIWAGPDTDTLTLGGGYRQSDDTHLNGPGADLCASLWASSLAQYGAPFLPGPTANTVGLTAVGTWAIGQTED